MAAIAQTTLIAASLAILIYIAVITTGNYLATQSSSHEFIHHSLFRAQNQHKTSGGIIV